MRTARVAIWATCLVLVLLPVTLLVVAHLYELWLVAEHQAHLERIAQEAAAAPRERLEELGRIHAVQLVVLDSAGGVVADSHTEDRAVFVSPIAGWVGGVLDRAGVGSAAFHPDPLAPGAAPLRELEEVRAALDGTPRFATRDLEDALIFAYALPLQGGGALYAVRGSERGLRRLLALRGELVKLALYETVAAVLVALLLSRWLVRPLEQLADSVRSYPNVAPANPALLTRADELGQLARAVQALTTTLEARRRATADLAADLAHELKNPLATVAAAAELIATTEDPSAEKRRLVHAHVEEAVNRMRATADELLALARLEAALPQERREAVACAALLEGVAAEYRRDPRWAAFRFTVEVAADAGEVVVVRDAWLRCLRNLVDNALVQPMERREIVLSARRTPAGVVFGVRDHGPGVSPGDRDKIFRRFFSRRPEGATPGTGLGLSIVTAVAEAHGGRVELDAAVSPGAQFNVLLPA